MAKNKTKQAKIKEVSFRVHKAKLQRALKNILLCIGNYENEYSVLNAIKIHVESDYMEMTATDGMTLIKACVELDEAIKGSADALLSGIHLAKMKLVKNYTNNSRGFSVFDFMQFTIKEDKTIITDEQNEVTYQIPHKCGQYPKTEELFIKYDEKKHIKVGINAQYLARLKELPARPGVPLVMILNKEDELKPIGFEANGGCSRSGGYEVLIMPIMIRE